MIVASFAHRMCHLIHQTRVRRLVRPPSQQPRAMPEAVTRDLIIEHFDDDFAPERFSLGSLRAVPSASFAGRLAGEAGASMSAC
jgi:hypothetical protein